MSRSQHRVAVRLSPDLTIFFELSDFGDVPAFCSSIRSILPAASARPSAGLLWPLRPTAPRRLSRPTPADDASSNPPPGWRSPDGLYTVARDRSRPASAGSAPA